MADSASGTRLRHPNRERASARATQLLIVILLVASAVLISVVLFGGLTIQAGARWLAGAFVLIYALMAYYVLKWRRGVLAMSAGLSLFFAITIATTIPAWFERVKEGYATALLPTELLALTVVLTVIVQLLLVVASIIGFNQGWHLEIEERSGHDDEDEYDEYDEYDEPGRGEPAPAH